MQFGQHSKQVLHPHGLRENLEYRERMSRGRWLAMPKSSRCALGDDFFQGTINPLVS